ncbi:glycosyltransferase family A protein [Enterobacter sichuanensis]|uniref:glycosyltransferase family A protein n=1 Tax=Enterobacter sichuanensis TaxID=2071710 RepID=UPI001AAFEB0B|nr:glycosyltransferase family A protein [Enterobacter sichuanensis]MBO2933392.1 glycosyltransferase family 2 protein [Enterobacter sichuanensis]
MNSVQYANRENSYDSFPIIVMTRNDAEFLRQCVTSILNTVTINVHVYIIDNHSDDETHKKILCELEHSDDCIEVIRNKNNLWVLGVNDTIRKIKENHNGKYFFLTDGDIDFSACLAKPCWLTYLIGRMNNNISLGKIGLSLSWDYLEKHKELDNILHQELGLYSEEHKIDDLYVSFVDTTATIFRKDWSIDPSSGLYPDHMRYLRPELYSCRTAKNIVVEHLGWFLYKNSSKLQKHHLNEKIKCFTLVGGDVKHEILSLADKRYRWGYKFFSKSIRRLWFLRRYFYFFRYIFIKGIRHLDGQGYIKPK